jgi:hypothetical protein
MKEKKETNKVTSEISAKCKHDLEVLGAYLELNLSQVVQFVLEKNVSAMLYREANKRLKPAPQTTEE